MKSNRGKTRARVEGGCCVERGSVCVREQVVVVVVKEGVKTEK